MIVVDTNIVSYLFLNTSRSERAEQLFLRDPEWAAPLLWRSEFRNVLAVQMRKRLLALNAAMAIQAEAESLMSGREFSIPSRDILALANVSACSAYDCEFVSLARYLNVNLVTADKQILDEFPDVAVSPEKLTQAL